MQVTFRHSVLFLLHRLSGGGGLGKGRMSVNKLTLLLVPLS